MPFALNDSTQFISPTKTPEYLAAGRPVVSTSIKDVIRHYGELEGVFVASDAQTFARACDNALLLAKAGETWWRPVDELLEGSSWDKTFMAMKGLMDAVISRNDYAHLQTPKNLLRKPNSSQSVILGEVVAVPGL